MNIIGSRIKKARETKGLTQVALAELIGVNSQTVWRWENGSRVPDLLTLQKIAKALDSHSAYLTGDIDFPTNRTLLTQDFDILPDDITPESKKQSEMLHKVFLGALYRKMKNENNPVKITTDVFNNDATLTPEKTVKLPVLSPEQTACCGSGMVALDITSWEGETAIVPLSDIGAEYDDMRPPFVISTDGDSMTEWSIPNGSRVVINPAEEVHSMDIALINYMGKLALKKVRFNRDKSVDLLSSDGNIMHIESEDAVPEVFNVVGKAMSLTSKIRHGI